jgi:HD superfamily phosphohydrolase
VARVAATSKKSSNGKVYSPQEYFPWCSRVCRRLTATAKRFRHSQPCWLATKSRRFAEPYAIQMTGYKFCASSIRLGTPMSTPSPLQTTLELRPPKPKSKVYRDDIHGDIVLDELAVQLIDTPEFQRLDGIRQLGFAYLVFRTAKHTRFEHSIGCYHIARALVGHVVHNHARANERNPFDDLPDAFGKDTPSKLESLRTLLGACALLHDIAHIPFGHTLEDEFASDYDPHDSFGSVRLWRFVNHEDSRVKAVLADSNKTWLGTLPNRDFKDLIYVILTYADRDQHGNFVPFEQLLNERISKAGLVEQHRLSGLKEAYTRFKDLGIYHPYMTDFISNTICADSLDYVVRDKRHVGLPWELNTRLYKYFFITEPIPHQTADAYEGQITTSRRLALRLFQSASQTVKRDLVTAILEVMHARFGLTSHVYYHRVKAAASVMLVRAMKDSGIQEGNYYDLGSRSISKHSDESLLETINIRGSHSGEIVEALRRRQLYRPVVIVPKAAAVKTKLGFDTFVDRLRTRKDERLHLEQILATEAGFEELSHHVLIYCPGGKMQAKRVDVRVQLDPNRIWPLSTYPDEELIMRELKLLSDKYHDLWHTYLFLHPVQAGNEYIRNTVIETFCGAMRLDIRSVILPQQYVSTADLRLRYYREWLLHRPGIFAEDALQIEVVAADGAKWRPFVARAESRVRDAFDFEGLFDALLVQVYIDRFVTEELRLSIEERTSAAAFLWESAKAAKETREGLDRTAYYYQFASDIQNWVN